MEELTLSLLIAIPEIVYLVISLLSLRYFSLKYYRLLFAFISAGSSSFVFFFLENQFLSSNLRYSIVAHSIAPEMSPFERIVTLWSGTEGTLLLWFFLLTIVQILGEIFAMNLEDSGIIPVSLAVFSSLILTGLIFERPFQLLLSSEFGPGTPPTLRSWYIAFHPPLSFSAYSLALLLYAVAVSGVTPSRTMLKRLTGLSLLIASLLLFAIVSGAFWANDVLWGGLWTWDPVENLSLMLLLLSLLPVHFRDKSIDTQLVAMGSIFPGVLFSTLVIRSGLLKDPHSYASSSQTLFYLILFLLSTVPLMRKVKVPSEFLLDLRNQGRTIWQVSAISIITIIVITTTELSLVSFFTGEKTTSPRMFYHTLIIPLLLVPLSLTVFLELRDLVGMSNKLVGTLFTLVLGLYFIEVTSINLSVHAFSLFPPALVSVGIYLALRTPVVKIRRNNFLLLRRTLIHVILFLLLLSFLSNYHSVRYQNFNFYKGDQVEVFGGNLVVKEIVYTNNYGKDIFPWDRPFNMTWKLTVTVSYQGSSKILYAGWNPTHSFYSIPAIFNSVFTSFQVFLRYDGIAPFYANDTTPLLLNIQVRAMFNGYFLHTLGLILPTVTLFSSFVFLTNSRRIDDYYD